MGTYNIGNANDYGQDAFFDASPAHPGGTFMTDLKNVGPSTMYLLSALKDRIKNGSGRSVMADQRNAQAQQDQENAKVAMDAFSKLSPQQKQLVQLKAMQMTQQGAPSAMAQAPQDF